MKLFADIHILDDYRLNDPFREVAGVYITEHRAVCVIGKLAENQSTGENYVSVGVPRPKTENDEKNPRKHKTYNKGSLTPEQLLKKCVKWLVANSTRLESVAIACFGPFESLQNPPDIPDRKSNYGKLSALPSYEDWGGTELCYIFAKGFQKQGVLPLVRVYLDTESGAFGEYWYHCPDDEERQSIYHEETSVAFLKFSRSVNGGIARQGKISQGRFHPLMSAIPPRRYSEMIDGCLVVDEFGGCCLFHGDCIEGLVGLRALEERTGLPFEDIPNDETVLWRMVAYYIANLCISVTATLSPSRIVVGGRVFREESKSDPEFANRLLEMVRGYFYGYVAPWNEEHSRCDISPNYKEMRDEKNYICLPVKPELKVKLSEHANRNENRAMPVRHGALRLAAYNLISSRSE